VGGSFRRTRRSKASSPGKQGGPKSKRSGARGGGGGTRNEEKINVLIQDYGTGRNNEGGRYGENKEKGAETLDSSQVACMSTEVKFSQSPTIRWKGRSCIVLGGGRGKN